MATWHQQQAMRRNPMPLYHATQWSVISDPPGELLTVIRHSTEAAAKECLANMEKNGRGVGAYILPPGGIKAEA